MAASETQWFSGPLEREGQAQYVHLIRGPGDPQRGGADRSEGRDWNATDQRGRLNARSPVYFAQLLKQHLGDSAERTFNRIVVELFDVTADVAFGSHVDTALWTLVERRACEHTCSAPVLFRQRDPYSTALGVLGLPINPRLPRWCEPGVADDLCDKCREAHVPGHDHRLCPHDGCHWSAQVCDGCGGFATARGVLEDHLRECVFALARDDVRWDDAAGAFATTSQLSLFACSARKPWDSLQPWPAVLPAR